MNFANTESKIHDLSVSIEVLQKFNDRLKGNKDFDDADRKVVQSKLLNYTKMHKSLVDLLQQKRNMHDKHIKKVEESMVRRQIILQEINEGFQRFPDLLDIFVNKQITLQSTLENIKTKLDQL